MAKLNLNVAARPFVNERPLVVATVLLGLLLAGFSFWNIYTLFRALDESRVLATQEAVNRAEEAEAKAAAESLAAAVTEKEKKRIRAVSATMTSLIRQRQLSWTRLFEQLEGIVPRDVRVLRVVPNVVKDRMHLVMQCRAKDNESKLMFYRRLYEPPFSDAYIMSDTMQSDSIEFSVNCRYDPAGPDLHAPTGSLQSGAEVLPVSTDGDSSGGSR